MVLVTGAETPKSPRIMAHQDCAHMVCECSLPRIILTHTTYRAPLDHRHFIGMDPMDSLPGVAA